MGRKLFNYQKKKEKKNFTILHKPQQEGKGLPDRWTEIAFVYESWWMTEIESTEMFYETQKNLTSPF